MRGVILAAGKGRRIFELTNGLPKSYLTIGGRRILDHQLDSLKRIGVKSVVMVIGYRSQLFEQDYGNRGIILLKNPFYDRTNVLASLWFARDYLSEGFYFMHADTYFDPTILEDLGCHTGDVVLAVNKKCTVPEDMKVQADGDRVVRINKEMTCEQAFGEFTGVARITSAAAPRVLYHIRDRIENQARHDDFFETVLQDLIDEGIPVGILDIGTRVSVEIDFPEDYYLAKELYMNESNGSVADQPGRPDGFQQQA